MKRFLIYFFISLVSALTAVAETSTGSNALRATVESLLDRIKSEQSEVCLVDYVSWEQSFAKSDPAKLKEVGINSKEQLKEHFRAFFADPSSGMQPMLRGAKSEAVREKMKAMIQIHGPRFAAWKKQKIASTKYSIMEIESEDRNARVTVKASTPKGDRLVTLFFEKLNDSWLLQSKEFGDFGGALRLISG